MDDGRRTTAASRPDHADLRFGEKPQDLSHQPRALICFENVLGVRGAVEDQQLFRIRRSLKLVANAGESQDAIAAEIVTCRDE